MCFRHALCQIKAAYSLHSRVESLKVISCLMFEGTNIFFFTIEYMYTCWLFEDKCYDSLSLSFSLSLSLSLSLSHMYTTTSFVIVDCIYNELINKNTDMRSTFKLLLERRKKLVNWNSFTLIFIKAAFLLTDVFNFCLNYTIEFVHYRFEIYIPSLWIIEANQFNHFHF